MSALFSFARSLETGPTSYFTHYTNLLHLPFFWSCSSVSEVLNFRKARCAEATFQRAILNLASSELQSRGQTGWLTRHDLELLKINFLKMCTWQKSQRLIRMPLQVPSVLIVKLLPRRRKTSRNINRGRKTRQGLSFFYQRNSAEERNIQSQTKVVTHTYERQQFQGNIEWDNS